MPTGKVKLPYNEKGMNMANEIESDVEGIGGSAEFSDVPVSNAQDRMAGGGDIDAYYRIGGGIKFYSGHKGSGAAKEKEKEMSAKREERFKRLKEEAKARKAKRKDRKRILKGPLAGAGKITKSSKEEAPKEIQKTETKEKGTSSTYRPGLGDKKTMSERLKYNPSGSGQSKAKETSKTDKMFADAAAKRKAKRAADAAKKANKVEDYHFDYGPVDVKVEGEAVEKVKKVAKKVGETGKRVAKRAISTAVLSSPTPVGAAYRGYKAAKVGKKAVKAGKKYVSKKVTDYLTSQGWTPPKSAAKDAAKIASEKAKNKK